VVTDRATIDLKRLRYDLVLDEFVAREPDPSAVTEVLLRRVPGPEGAYEVTIRTDRADYVTRDTLTWGHRGGGEECPREWWDLSEGP